jgi:hypothetical protein
MADLILHDTEYETDSNESYRLEFDPTDPGTLERIEAVFAAGKAQSGEGKELLSQLCASSFIRTNPVTEKNAMAVRLKKMFRLITDTKKVMSNQWGNMKNRSRNRPSNHITANGRVVQASFGS